MSTPSVSSWKARQILTVPFGDARSLGLSPDGTGLVAARDGEVVRYDDEGRVVWRVPLPGTGSRPEPRAAAGTVVWSPEGDVLFLLDAGRLLLVDADTGQALEPPVRLDAVDEVTAVALSPDARRLAAGLRSGDVLLLHRGDSSVTRLRGVDPVAEVCWIPGPQDILCVATATSAQLWEPHGGTMTGTLGGPFHGLCRMACSPDGRTIAIGDRDGLRLLDPGSGREMSREYVPYRTNGLAFSHDGTLLIAGFERGGLYVFGPGLDLLGRLSGRVTGPGDLSLSASGLVAARLDADTAAVWEPPGAVPRAHRRRDPAAVRRWANAMGVTVGKVHTRTGSALPGCCARRGRRRPDWAASHPSSPGRPTVPGTGASRDRAVSSSTPSTRRNRSARPRCRAFRTAGTTRPAWPGPTRSWCWRRTADRESTDWSTRVTAQSSASVCQGRRWPPIRCDRCAGRRPNPVRIPVPCSCTTRSRTAGRRSGCSWETVCVRRPGLLTASCSRREPGAA